MAAMKRRVCVVTAGHMSTCPRMLKAADALYGAGFDVRVVSASHTPWAVEADKGSARRADGVGFGGLPRATARGVRLSRVRAAGSPMH